MRFSVIIPTLGRPQLLAETLDSVFACDPLPHEVIVVDGDPESSARAVLDARRLGAGATMFKYLRRGANSTMQRNEGIKAAEGDVVVFLDDDVEVSRTTFAALEKAYSDHEVVGATGHLREPGDVRVGGADSRLRRLLFASSRQGTFTPFGYPHYLRSGAGEQDVEFMPGCFMTARRAVAADVWFDEGLRGYALAEDEDFSYRLSRRGRIRYLPEIEVLHKKIGFGSLDSRSLGRLVVVNRWYLFGKNFRRTPVTVAQFALLVGMLMGHRALNRQWRGVVGILEGARDVIRGRA